MHLLHLVHDMFNLTSLPRILLPIFSKSRAARTKYSGVTSKFAATHLSSTAEVLGSSVLARPNKKSDFKVLGRMSGKLIYFCSDAEQDEINGCLSASLLFYSFK